MGVPEYVSSASTNGTISSRYICDCCGITFITKDEKEEHIKLEHSEHKPPSPVG